jgi:GTP pyrophosphokinase
VTVEPASARRIYGPRFESALAFASSQHLGQERKGSGAPYVTHVIGVASLVGEYGGDEDQAIAALCHDLMEDCGVTRGELAARYGDRVARIVEACSDATTKPKPPWRERKERHLAHTRGAPADVKLVAAADKLHNAQTIVRDLRRPSVGEVVWSRFTAGREPMIWYLGAMTDALADGWEHEILGELRATVAELSRG